MSDDNRSRFPGLRGGGGFLEVFKTILTSPVGGWALAVIVVGYISWLTAEDRKAIYQDMQHLRDVVMPVIRDGPRVAYDNQRLIESAKAITEDNNRILQEIRSMMNLPLRNTQTLEEIKRELKKNHPPPERPEP
jgi:hypothetical protein